MLKNSLLIVFFVLLVACNSTDNEQIDQNLALLVAQNQVELGGVIACAASANIENNYIVYLYPRPGVTNIRYFETDTENVDPNNYEFYKELLVQPQDFFNGYLLQIVQESSVEKWGIVTFEEEGVLQISNPIRIKHRSKPTFFSTQVAIDYEVPLMPQFNWENVAQADDIIYFQIVGDDMGNLLSGTYTHEVIFQYYNTDNVVLNITRNTPPNLENEQEYTFTVLGVSEDNWVNGIGEKSFQIE